jgi:spermidine synthase
MRLGSRTRGAGKRSDPPLRGADPTFRKAMAVERQRLLLFYQAALNAQAGHPEAWARDMERVLEGDGGNAYYRWFG